VLEGFGPRSVATSFTVDDEALGLPAIWIAKTTLACKIGLQSRLTNFPMLRLPEDLPRHAISFVIPLLTMNTIMRDLRATTHEF
jgi:hypothetical protein